MNPTNPDQSIQAPHRREVFIRWISPTWPWLVLNTDGASKGPLKIDGGGASFAMPKALSCVVLLQVLVPVQPTKLRFRWRFWV